MKRNGRSGVQAVTLLELLVVLGVMAVLVVVAFSVVAHVKMNARRVQCLSNLRQIGMAIHLYANEHSGYLPLTTHSTGSRHIDQSWIYSLSSYLGNVDQVRVCPAEPPLRQKQIIERRATSYALNELVFDAEEYRQIYRIPYASRTLLATILSESRTPSPTWDHVHSGEWSTWQRMLNDVQVDRHLTGSQPQTPAQRVRGSANYLYADGHVENIAAREMKGMLDSGFNPAAVPTGP